jgi:curved DNA-binding protein
MTKTFYDVLGVERDASSDEIKSAYRKLARRYHPDVSKETDAEEKFKEVGEAYDVLKDDQKRSAYDHYGTVDPQRPAHQYADINDIFRTLREQFVQTGGGGRVNIEVGPNGEIIQKIVVPVDLLITGGSFTFRYVVSNDNPQSGTFSFQHSIGTTILKKNTSVGTRITLPNVPNAEFILIPGSTASCKVQGLDLVIQRDGDVLRIAAGLPISVAHPNGNKYDVKVPPNITAGLAVRLAGKGLTHQNGAVGNLLVIIKMVVPSLSNDKKNELKTLIES